MDPKAAAEVRRSGSRARSYARLYEADAAQSRKRPIGRYSWSSFRPWRRKPCACAADTRPSTDRRTSIERTWTRCRSLEARVPLRRSSDEIKALRDSEGDHRQRIRYHRPRSGEIKDKLSAIFPEELLKRKLRRGDVMHADLVKLLELQAKDSAVAEVERRLDALRGRDRALDQAVDRARGRPGDGEAEGRRRRAAAGRAGAEDRELAACCRSGASPAGARAQSRRRPPP